MRSALLLIALLAAAAPAAAQTRPSPVPVRPLPGPAEQAERAHQRLQYDRWRAEALTERAARADADTRDRLWRLETRARRGSVGVTPSVGPAPSSPATDGRIGEIDDSLARGATASAPRR